MTITRWNEPYPLNDESYMALYDEAMEYFADEVLPLYTDVVVNDPEEGFHLALTDMLSNDSNYERDGEILTWREALALGKEIYDLSGLNDVTKRIGPEQLKPRKGGIA